MPVKVDPLIVEELTGMDLTLWEAKHPRQQFINVKGKSSTREDKGWVIVALAGPGVVEDCRAGAATLRKAVDTALTFHFADRVPGVRGAMMRLEKAMWDLGRTIMEAAYNADPDDDIPF